MRREVWRGWWTNGTDGIVLRGIRPYSGMLVTLAPAARSSGGVWSKHARVEENRLRSPLSWSDGQGVIDQGENIGVLPGWALRRGRRSIW